MRNLEIVLAVTSALAAAEVSMPSIAGAISVEFTPVIGHYTPVNSQIADNEASLAARQADATAFGARLGVWVIPRVAVEASFLTASSGIQFASGGLLAFDAVTTQYDVRARFRVNDPAAGAGLDVIAGLGMSDINELFSDTGEGAGFESPSAFTIVVGVGGTVPVTDRVKLRFDLEDHIHDANYEIDEDFLGTPVNVDQKQHDIVLLAGIVIPIWD